MGAGGSREQIRRGAVVLRAGFIPGAGVQIRP
jgi:hypothetical protein